jgi:protein SCO1/2
MAGEPRNPPLKPLNDYGSALRTWIMKKTQTSDIAHPVGFYSPPCDTRAQWGCAWVVVPSITKLVRKEGPRASTRLRRMKLVTFLVFAGVSGGCRQSYHAGSADNDAPLPVIATLPDFSLIECRERPVSRSDLLGHVWVANFVFTNCAGPCPMLTLRMRSIHEELAGEDKEADVKLVTFTLDPQEDTPPVLQRYADRHQADPKRWWFLTGADQDAMHKLVQQGFLQSVKKATANEPIVHSTYFVLLDRQAQIRAVYDGLDPKSKGPILRDIRRLRSEPPTS